VKTAAFSISRKVIVRSITTLLIVGALLSVLGGIWFPHHPASVADRARIIADAEPVLSAIHHFEHDTGHPPATLGALTPRYLPSIPEPTSHSASGKNYLYFVESNQWRLAVPLRGERNSMLSYSSIGDYPKGNARSPVTRIGAWAYYNGNPY